MYSMSGKSSLSFDESLGFKKTSRLSDTSDISSRSKSSRSKSEANNSETWKSVSSRSKSSRSKSPSSGKSSSFFSSILGVGKISTIKTRIKDHESRIRKIELKLKQLEPPIAATFGDIYPEQKEKEKYTSNPMRNIKSGGKSRRLRKSKSRKSRRNNCK
jgi:protein tyrosine/serine phosphatase